MPSLGDRLLVRRYDPGPEAEGQEVPKIKKRKVARKDPLVEVAPSFARIFKGGPQRHKSDLPVGEDEGLQEVPREAAAQAETADAGPSWLSSLEVPEDQPKAELDWLSSLKKKAKPKEASQPKVEKAEYARSDDGQALPIPPFWRTASEEELETQLLKLRETMLPRIRRLAKDAVRAEKMRAGQLKPRPVRV